MPPTISPANRERELNRVLAEYLKAVDQGQAPPPAIWLAAHSQLRPELDEFLNACETVDSVLQPLRVPQFDNRFDSLHFANYELQDEIGVGGMSVVYKARQHHPPRIVALKMMSGGRFATAMERQRFRTEIEAVTRLDHPQIVSVFEVGEAEGRPYFTMKYCSGGNLEKRLSSLRSDPKVVARMMADLARAVHHAHQHGVLHRDLKPSNVVLDDAGVPFLTDFGLARLAEGADLTKTGELVGTAAYMAPEQASGRPNAVTTATDVHGLGSILYACLTGAPPFRAATYVESLERARSYDPPAPSRINSIVPADLDAICLKCLNKEPSRRYASAADLADDLDRYLTCRPVRARLTPWPERLVRWARRRPELCGLVLTAMVALVVLAVGFIVHQQRMSEAKQKLTNASSALQLEQDAQLRYYANNTFHASTQLTNRRAIEARAGLALLCDPATSTHREFAWRYLWRQTCFFSRKDAWHGHTGRILAMNLSSDGHVLATAATDGTVRFWNANTGLELGRASIPDSRVFDLDFAAGNQSVYVYSVDPRSRLFEVSLTGRVRMIAQYPGVSTIRLAPDKQSFLAQFRKDLGNNHRWRIATLDISSGQPTETLLHGHGYENALTVPETGDWIATLGIPLPESVAEPTDDNKPLRSITLFHRRSKEIRCITDLDAEPFHAFAIAPEGQYVAAASRSTVYLYDVASGRRLWQRVVWDSEGKYPWCNIQTVRFRQKGNHVLTAGANRFVTALDTLTGAVYVNEQFGNFPTDVLWPNGRTGLFIGYEQSPYVCYWTKGPEITKYDINETWELGDEGWSLAISSDNKWIIAATDNQSSLSTITWVRKALTPKAKPDDIPPKILYPSPISHAALAAAVVTAPNHRQLYSASFDNSVVAWDVNSRKLLWMLPITSANSLRSMAITPDGRLIATGDREGKIYLVDTQAQSIRSVLHGHHGRMVRALRFFRRGSVLASGGHDGQVLLWDMTTMQSTPLANVSSKIHCLALSPDGRVLTASTESGQLISWDLDTCKQIGLIYAHASVANCVDYSPDGLTLASGGGDWKLRLWHVATGLPLAALNGHRGPVMAVAFTPDGNVLASTGLDKTIRLWRAEPTLP